MEYQPKTGVRCTCKRGVQRDNCPECEGTGWRIDFAAIRARSHRPVTAGTQLKFRTGDQVREIDGRHVGTVISQFGWTVRVQWEDSCWKEDLQPEQLVKVLP